MKAKMNKLAADLKFEQAQKLKENIKFLKDYQGKSEVVSPRIRNIDVYSYADDKHHAYVNFLKIINGAVSQSYTLTLKKKINESREDLLSLALIEIRQKIPSNAKTIILPFEIDFQLDNVKYLFPQRGEKLKLLKLSKLNALNAKKEKLRQLELMNKKNKSKIVLKKLQQDLHLKYLPEHIECFDNSNLQGSNPVAACVVFKNGKPSKKNYRHYNIKTVEGIDDFSSMQEIVFRRYKRLLDEKKQLPQLIVVDGGKGQLNAAIKSLKQLKIHKKIAIIGIAKRLDEIFIPNNSFPLYLDKKSESLRLIQQLRNEAHRFGISHHRQKRSKQFIDTELIKIKGIGEKTVHKLLLKFKSVGNIRNTNIKEITSIIGNQKAQLVAQYFRKKEQ